jgi:hypothetical protein
LKKVRSKPPLPWIATGQGGSGCEALQADTNRYERRWPERRGSMSPGPATAQDDAQRTKAQTTSRGNSERGLMFYA